MAVVELANLDLASEKGKTIPFDMKWLLSLSPQHESEVVTGEYAGKTLKEYIEARGIGCLGRKAQDLGSFPFSVKLIENAIEGVVQINPNPSQDSLWYVVDAAPEARIGLGFAQDVTYDQIKEGIEKNTLLSMMNMVSVSAGDVLKVDRGTPYMIGGNITMLDIQHQTMFEDMESDDILSSISLKPVPARHDRGEWMTDGQAKWCCLGKVDSFDADLFELNGRMDMEADDQSFKVLIFIDRGAVIEDDDQILHAQKFSTFFVEAGSRPFHITGNCQFIMVRIA